MKPRRVVILIADDWSPLAGCYGSPVIQTPHIDALAAEGTVFRRAYCASPSCGPSRATILTGLHSYTHGQYGHPHGSNFFRLRTDVNTLPRLLQKAGVYTGCLGKRHIEPVKACGFNFVSSKVLQPVEGYEAEIDEFLRQAGEQDYFLYIGSTLPHRTSEGFDDLAYHSLGKTSYNPADIPIPSFLSDLPGVRKDLAEYYTAVTRFDTWVGRVLDKFRVAGQYEGTLFLVMSDHGMPFVGAKASPFESGHRCPLIMAAPGVLPSGKQTEALACWPDLTPTILEWFGQQPPIPCHGASLLGVLRDGGKPAQEVYLSHMFHGVTEYYPYRILVRDRYKLIHRLIPESPMPVPPDLLRSDSFLAMAAAPEKGMGVRTAKGTFLPGGDSLFDLLDDPDETHNLINDPAHAEILAEMRTALKKHRQTTEDPLLPVEVRRAQIVNLLHASQTYA